MSDLKQQLLSYRPDRANGALLPAGLALVLLAGAALQLGLPQGAAVPPALGVWRAPDRRLPMIAEVGAPDLAARPSLFSPLRLGRTVPDEIGGLAPRPVGPLDGTFVLGSVQVGRAKALLLRDEGGRVLRMAPGGSYRGWHLLRIEADGARFRKGVMSVHIGFGASAPAGGLNAASSESESNSE
ncbi:hypothetical protein NSE01_08640 [Novosphingobium sediminis]|uniref:Uncharacterized protein n=1 Tax=Novosphingobium sediminis TaxID=707214 RepID=A0A512AH65_9SPHN|nr:hypothetical protein [Novosphingobium sediminis]GEN99031.1 hypothetical protein NSE01_08640 [Novosphingobium sediminis]